MLDNGPYVVFAPTNEAFAALPPEQLDALKADPAALTDLVYYHEFLGLLGTDDVKGQRPTQQGAEINVDGEGGDIKVNETAKLVCGGSTKNARIYLIDTVLDPSRRRTRSRRRRRQDHHHDHHDDHDRAPTGGRPRRPPTADASERRRQRPRRLHEPSTPAEPARGRGRGR